jgi:hypothetical protein
VLRRHDGKDGQFADPYKVALGVADGQRKKAYIAVRIRIAKIAHIRKRTIAAAAKN